LGNEIERWFMVGRHPEAEYLIPGGDRLPPRLRRAACLARGGEGCQISIYKTYRG
jgi:hypothetical protein